MKNKKDLNKIDIVKRIMEFIKENQFRLFFLTLIFISVLFLIYMFVIINPNVTPESLFKNPINYILIVIVFYIIYQVKPIAKQIWEQTDIRDNIEKQTAIKLEIENIKLLKELGNDLKEYNLSKERKNPI